MIFTGRRSTTSSCMSCCLLTLILATCLCPKCTAADRGARFCGIRLVKMLRKLCRFGLASPPTHRSHATYIFMRNAPSISETCCAERCTFDYLRSYCRPAPAKWLGTSDILRARRSVGN